MTVTETAESITAETKSILASWQNDGAKEYREDVAKCTKKQLYLELVGLRDLQAIGHMFDILGGDADVTSAGLAILAEKVGIVEELLKS